MPDQTSTTAIDEEFKRRAQRVLDRVNAMIQEDYAASMPSIRYWRLERPGRRARLYTYTVETANEGKYWAQEYVAYGPGAMTKGRMHDWKETRRVGSRTRRAAKARALKWYQQAAA